MPTNFHRFPDHTAEMFGRKANRDQLLNRASTVGLTALTGHPYMGKTWLLEDLGRRLSNAGHLVGYHECRGTSSDMLLRAVEDLYTRWLADASNLAQAKTLWQRHHDKLVIGAARTVGLLFDTVAKLNIAKELAKGAQHAQSDLQTAGMSIPKLDYDTARDIVNMLADVTDKPIVLILDAWEKSTSIESEFNTLDMFLRRAADWKSCHIYLGIRHPELDKAHLTERAFEHANDMVTSSPRAAKFKLDKMNLDDDAERERLLQHVRLFAKPAAGVSDDQLLEWINGFPGVVSYWRNSNDLQTTDRMIDLAKQAYTYQHRDLETRLNNLEGDQLKLAIRLALLPRLSESAWQALREVILDNFDDDLWHTLTQQGVLQGETHPTFGHDTRHGVAQQWCINKPNVRPSVRSQAEKLILSLAANVTEATDAVQPYAEALTTLRPTATAFSMPEDLRAIAEAPAYLFIDDKHPDFRIFDRGLYLAMKRHPNARWLLNAALVDRGLTKGKLIPHDIDGAIADFTIVIDMPNASTEQRADALFNRGVAKEKLIPPDISGAIADYTDVIDMAHAPTKQLTLALVNRGVVRKNFTPMNLDGVIADFTAVIDMADAPTPQRAMALNNRGATKIIFVPPDIDGAITDCTSVINMADAPTEQRANAFFNRGLAKKHRNPPDIDGAITDYTSAIDILDAPTELRANALFNRGAANGNRVPPDIDGVIADNTTLIDMIGTPTELRAMASANLTLGYLQQNAITKAIKPAVAVILSNMVPDRSVMIVEWFAPHYDTLRDEANNTSTPPDLRGAALAFVVLGLMQSPDTQAEADTLRKAFADDPDVPREAVARCEAIIAAVMPDEA